MLDITTPVRYKELQERVDTFRIIRKEDFEWIEQVGKGQFGKIWRCHENITGYGYPVAIKEINKETIKGRGMTLHAERELRVHSQLVHSNICRYYGFFQTREKLYVMLEYCSGGNLYEFMRSQGGHFEEPQAANFAAQIARGLRHTHAKRVLHRDLKPENILLDGERRIKLADYGWGIHSLRPWENAICGTLDFTSPEMLSMDLYREDADIWSLGAIIYEMLTGVPPFRRDDNKDDTKFTKTTQAVLDRKFEWPIWPEVSPEAKDAVGGLLSPYPEDRLPLNRLLVHKWILKHVKDD